MNITNPCAQGTVLSSVMDAEWKELILALNYPTITI